MKNILLYLSCFFISFNLFSQVKMDVWKKNPNLGQTVTKMQASQLPKTFESTLPDGTIEIYDRWNVPAIEVETNLGKKNTYTPIAYKGRKTLTFVTYNDGNWSGHHQSQNGKSYSMTADKVTQDTLDLKKTNDFCNGGLPTPTNFKNKSLGQTVPVMSSALARTDYYNQSIPINKNLTVYAEVTNDVHRAMQFLTVNTGDFGVISVAKTQTWVTNAFLGVAAVYGLEGLTVALNKIYIWETKDNLGYEDWYLGPQTGYQSGGVGLLSYFGTKIGQNIPVNPNNTTSGVTSHFKHLLHGNAGYGGIAYIGGNADGYSVPTTNYIGTYSYACSNIKQYSLPSSPSNLSSFTYNWPIYCLSHEMGHNCGSRHTQSYTWRNDANTLIGRLDSCYVCEGSGGQSTLVNTSAGVQYGSPCTITPCPTNCGSSNWTTIKVPGINGTIMSYCHTNGQSTFALSRGFGKYPRFAIRSTIDQTPYIPYSNVVAPTVTTTSPVTSITSVSATAGGNVTSDGGGGLLSKGVCWAVSPTVPTISNSTTNDGISTGVYTSSLTGLSAGTTYNVRAYATNSAGTSYGSTVTFTTSAPTVPVLTTTAMSAITQTTATSGGTITSSGGGNITAKGVCWSTTSGPTNALSTKTSNGTGTTSYTSSITGLLPSTTYYLRAYAVNGVGVGYGNEVTFTTSAVLLPTITTTAVSTYTNTTATLGGNITSSGGATVTRRGVCYATTTTPDTTKTKVIIGSGTGTFSQSVSGLTAGTTYYVRSFAVNSVGISYGAQVTFKTLTTPTVSTTAASSITSTGSTTGGNVTSAGGGSLTVTARGICYATTTNPTISNTVISAGTGTGTFTSTITGLTPGVLYYVRAYATNSYGTSYGAQISFRTLTTPTVTTTAASAIAQTSVTTGGNVTSAGGGSLTVTDRGVCYATTTNPTIGNSIVSGGTGTGTFTVSLTSLSPATVYYARAYATNSIGTAYGSQITFTTLSGSLPTLTTTAVSGITQTTATSGGNISSDGGSSVTTRGICYATTQNPTTSNTVVSSGTGIGSFTSSLTGLTSSTTYYVRSFATNGNGTAYGNQVSFTTLATNTVPTVTTNAISSITSTSANAGGNVTADGGLTVTARGICYATTTSPTISNSVITSGTGTGSFSVSITGLSSGVTYYVRAYATNSLGTSYGAEQSFTTLTSPSVSTTSSTSVLSTTATTGGNVTSDGGATVTARGVCYGTSLNPTLSNSFTSDGTGTGTFTSNLTGLLENTTYYVRAYATNSVGTTYGSQISFTTSTGASLPTVTTTSASTITATSAVSGGNVTSSGSQSVSSRGVCWSTSPTPTISNSKTTNGSGTGTFTSTLSSLTASTTYYVRAYATSTVGTAYGSQIQFTTSSAPSTSCQVTTFAAYKLNGFWRFKWNINPNCTSYTVTVSRYNNTDPLNPPVVGATPTATGNRLTNYVPTSTEINQGFIDQQMNPQPSTLGYWYSFDVKCNATTCSGSNTTRSAYFYFQ